MSEYQFYEFQAIDKPLNEDALKYLRSLSSRVQLSSSRAVYVYNWGDFRAREEEVLEKYFDALLYVSNFGSDRLMFRFPRGAVDVTAMEQYCVPDTISVKTTREYVVLDVLINTEESGWAEEGGGVLTTLVPLREDLLRGD